MRTLWLYSLVILTAPTAWATDLYVAASGLDDNPGTEARPFATLGRAREAIRVIKSRGAAPEPVTVFVRQGVYELEDTLRLGKEDSGTETAPIVYRAYPGETPVLVGGKEISGFAVYKQAILQVHVAAPRPTDGRARVLVFDGARQPLARFPNANPLAVGNGDWAYVDGTRYSMYADSPDENNYLKEHPHLDFWQRNIPRLTRTLKIKPEDVRPWLHPEQGEVSIFPRFNWQHFQLQIESFDAADRELNLRPGCYYEIRPGDRYFVQGLLEELDSPGEWYLDHEANVLYFWPPASMENKSVRLAALTRLVELRNCSHITIRGFLLECCNGTAATLIDCTDCRLAGNTIRNVGDADGCGVIVQGGQRNDIVGNDISDTGADGISVAAGDVASLTRAELSIDNNYIHHVGRSKRDAKGISLKLGFHDGRGLGDCAGISITHNLIHDTPQSGIFLWGSGLTIEYNRIRHTCTESEDTGAIGGGAIDWLGWLDTTIRYNFIHDTLGFGYDPTVGRWTSPYFTAALYPDWAASGVTIFGNVLARASRAGLFLHSGRDNVIENNIVVDGGKSQVHWRGWTTETGFWATMVDGWTANYEMASQHAAWQRVAALKDPRQVPLADHRVMTGNVFRRNIIYFADPHAALFNMEDVPLEHNLSDFNLVYHFGQPVRTGMIAARRGTGPNLIPNGGLEAAAVGGVPQGWSVPERLADGTRVCVVDDEAHEGAHSLLITPALPAAGTKRPETVYLTLGATPFQPGKAYCLSMWLKCCEPSTAVELSVFSWKKDVHSWEIHSTALLTSGWQRHQLVFRLPGEGDQEFKSTMDSLMWRINVPQGSADFWLDDISLQEVELADEWESWQARGMDSHSVVADPLFVDPEHDDYRLKPESPAHRLGFAPIPFDKIGPYQDELRASWPIVEASGVREARKGGSRPREGFNGRPDGLE